MISSTTYFKLVFHQDEESIDDIFDQGLRAKSNGQTDDAGAGQKRLDVYAEDRERLHQRNEDNDKNTDAVNYACQGAYLLQAQGGR